MPSRAGGSPCDFLPGIPDTTRIFSPGCSMNPGSMTPRIEPRLPLRPEMTCNPAVLTEVAPAFSSTNHSPFSCFLSAVACASRNSNGIDENSSDLEDLAFLLAGDLVDLADRLVGRLLNALEPLALVVLGDRRVLERFLEHLVGVAARRSEERRVGKAWSSRRTP